MADPVSDVPDDVLSSLGKSIYRVTVSHDVGFVFYGIYLVVFAIYISTTLRHPISSPASRLLFGGMLLLFFSTTSQFVADMAVTLEQLRGYLMASGVPLEDRRVLWSETHLGLFIAERWPPAINFVVSDLIVLWRATVVHPRRWWLRGLMWTMALADVVLWFCAAGFTSRDGVQRSLNPATDETLNTVSNCVSIATNLLGTCAIAVVAWNQKNLMGQVSGGRWRGDVARVLLLLVEAGGFWAMIQIAFATLQQINTGDDVSVDLATGLVAKLAVYLAAILPTGTMIIVRSQRSVEYTLNFGSEFDVPSWTPGTPPGHSSDTDEARASDSRHIIVSDVKAEVGGCGFGRPSTSMARALYYPDREQVKTQNQRQEIV